jgi:uncharacterized protein (DUF885 family)
MLYLSALLVLGCGLKAPPTAPSPDKAPASAPEDDAPPDAGEVISGAAIAGVTDGALRAVLHEHWEHAMRTSPTWATELGDHRYDDRIAIGSEENAQRYRAATLRFEQVASAIDAASLDEADRISRAVFLENMRGELAMDVCRFRHWSVSPRSNALGRANQLPELHPTESQEDAENLLARYRMLPEAIDASTVQLRRGLQEGLVANARSLTLVVEMLDRQLAEPVDAWPLVGLAEKTEASWAARDLWAEDLRRVVEEEVRPALERYRAFLADEALPQGRAADKEGLVGLALGAECYPAMVQHHTTLPLSAEEIHQTGLDELASIHGEFEVLGERVFGTSDLQEIYSHLRTDTELYFETAEQVEEKALSALAVARDRMPEYFGRLPQQPCGVERIPDYLAPYTTIAYYQPGSAERAGNYFVNVYAPETRPRHEAEVLAFHESIPGHHLQIAIAQENEEVPAFRRHGGITAFVEGWALYTERLADEMGMYTGDVDRLGMLSFDAWRASRLVVDTGVHHLGWTRTQAEDFMVENTPLARNNIVNEVDRYITTPGQALAYKTGQLEIWRMRRDAEAALGADFDIRGFHDAVLTRGALPLGLLDEQVQGWVDASRP